MKSIVKALCTLLGIICSITLYSCQKEQVSPLETGEQIEGDSKVYINFESEVFGQVITQPDLRAMSLIGQPTGSPQHSPALDWSNCDWDNESNKPILALVVSNAYTNNPTGGIHTVYKILSADEYTVTISNENPKKSPKIKVLCDVTLKTGTIKSEYYVSAFIMDKDGFKSDQFESDGTIGFDLELKHLDATKGNQERFERLIFGMNRIALAQAQGEEKNFLAQFRPVGSMLVLETVNQSNINEKPARHLSIQTDGFTRVGTLSLDPTKATNGQKSNVYSPYYSVQPDTQEMDYKFFDILEEPTSNVAKAANNRVTLMAIPTKGQDESYYFNIHYAYDEGGQVVNTDFDTFHHKYTLRFSRYYDGKSAYIAAPVGDIINEAEYFRTTWATDTSNPSISFFARSLDKKKTKIYYRKKGAAGWYRYQMNTTGQIEQVALPLDKLEPNAEYEVIISHLSGFYVNSSSVNKTTSKPTSEPNLKLIEQWGTSSEWSGLGLQFTNATNLDVQATDLPNFSKLTLADAMFRGATNLVGNEKMNEWNVSNITRFQEAFRDASKFNQPLDQWNVSNATSMTAMFSGASAFNQDLNRWDVSKVTRFDQMFEKATAFNGDISSWNVRSGTTLAYMFHQAKSFNQDISSWRPENNTSLSATFKEATSFNQPLNDWPVSNVTNLNSTFYGAKAFNQPLDKWDVRKVTNMNQTFLGATSFNQPLNSWSVSEVTSMYSTFLGASSFNQPLDKWNVRKVTNMGHIFTNASAFDQPLGAWQLNSITPRNTTTARLIFKNSGMSDTNIDMTLEGWKQNPDLAKDVYWVTDNANKTDGKMDWFVINRGWTVKP